MTVLIRDVTEEDFEAITSLLAELGRPDARVPEVYAEQLLDAGAQHLLAIDDGVAIGFCSLHLRRRLNWTTPEAWIPDLIVTEAARGTGTGRALLEAAETRARAGGCHALVLESGHERESAHAVYRAFGMSQGGLTFHKAL